MGLKGRLVDGREGWVGGGEGGTGGGEVDHHFDGFEAHLGVLVVQLVEDVLVVIWAGCALADDL